MGGKGCAKQLRFNLRGQEIVVNYIKEGSGSQALLTFHGFGQTAREMIPIGEATDCTAYHFDLFYHGRSFWPEELGKLDPRLWGEVLDIFLSEEGIDRFSLAGFSMGGKFALASLHAMGERIERIWLLAPDGIQTSTWYNMANYPLFIRPYFRSMIVKPWRFYNLIRVLERTGMVDKGLSKFASNHMDTRKKRRRVYYSWVMFKPLSFPLRKTAALIRKNRIKLIIFTGSYDRIITSDGMNRLLRHLPEGQLIELESGHNQLIKTAAAYIKQKKL